MLEPLNISPRLRQRIREGYESWRSGDIARMIEHYADDVVLNSPYAKQLGVAHSHWVEGREDVARHTAHMRELLSELELVDILSGAGYVSLLFEANGKRLVMVIEPDHEEKARRIMLMHSISE